MTTDEHQILASVETRLASPEFKARLLGMLAKSGIYQPPRSTLIHYRAETAARLVESFGSRAEAREALQQRFGISRRSAYRLIERALNMRQQLRLF